MHVNVSVTVKLAGAISLIDGRKFEESEAYNYFFVVFCVLESNISALVRDLLSNKSRFVSQLLEDNRRAALVIWSIFTIDLQTVIYYSTNHC